MSGTFNYGYGSYSGGAGPAGQTSGPYPTAPPTAAQLAAAQAAMARGFGYGRGPAVPDNPYAPRSTGAPTAPQANPGGVGGSPYGGSPFGNPGQGTSGGVATPPGGGGYRHEGPNFGAAPGRPADYFGTLTPFQQVYYQQNPTDAYSLARQQVSPQSTSPFSQYINSRYGDLYNQYGRASLNDPSLQWTDYLNRNLGGVRQQFQSLGALDRGFSLFNLDSGTGGRYVG